MQLTKQQEDFLKEQINRFNGVQYFRFVNKETNKDIINFKRVNHVYLNDKSTHKVEGDILWFRSEKFALQMLIRFGIGNFDNVSVLTQCKLSAAANKKLTDEQVAEIRSHLEKRDLLQSEIISKYGISRTSLRRIINGTTYREAG